jgi:uracil-DNA glycosylase
VEGVHPSPLSAKRGFFGSRPFSKINAVLRENGTSAIDWQIPDL